MRTLVIGTGFIGSAVAAYLRDSGTEVVQSSRSQGGGDVTLAHGAALDRHLRDHRYDQVVVVGQLNRPDIDWVIERIDGPRWVVLSSQQVTSAVPSSSREVALAREELALQRGACVLRPTMVYGKGRDLNISRLIRFMKRWHVAIVPGVGDQLVQPVHVDDIADLVDRHGSALLGDVFSAGGPEALPMKELVGTIGELVGVRIPTLAISAKQIGLAARAGAAFGLRQDQFQRLLEAKTADNTSAAAHFGWQPLAIGIRLEQAVLELAAEHARDLQSGLDCVESRHIVRRTKHTLHATGLSRAREP